MAERHGFEEIYRHLLEVTTKLKEGSCSLEDYMIETEDYGIKSCKIFDHLLEMVHQIDNRLDGIEARLDSLGKK